MKVRVRSVRIPELGDKLACLSEDHEVLTENGWKFFQELTKEDKVAILDDEDRLIYEELEELLYFPNQLGKMYHIANQLIDLNVTWNHTVCGHPREKKYPRVRWLESYDFMEAKDAFGKRLRYKKDAIWEVPDYQFILPEVIKNGENVEEIKVNMDSFLVYLGILYAEGWALGNEKIMVKLELLRINKE